MSALPIQLTPAPRDPPRESPRESLRAATREDSRAAEIDARDPDNRLVPIAVAAKTLGMSEGHLRRLCSSDRQLMRHARQVRSKWYIDRAYDPRLADASESSAEAEARASDALNRMPAKKRDKAIERAMILLKFREWRNTEGVCVRDDIKSFADGIHQSIGVRPTQTSLYRWHEQAGVAISLNAIASKLAGVKPGPSSGLCSEEAWADFCELYLTTKQWSVGKCHRHIRAAEIGRASCRERV